MPVKLNSINFLTEYQGIFSQNDGGLSMLNMEERISRIKVPHTPTFPIRNHHHQGGGNTHCSIYMSLSIDNKFLFISNQRFS